MKYLNGKNYVEVQGRRYLIPPNEHNLLAEREPPTSLRSQYQGINDTKVGRN